MNPWPFCANDGTCSCAKFHDNPEGCERRAERNIHPNVVNILSKTQPEVVDDRNLARELARQVHAGEIELKPFIVANHLTTIEQVVAFVREIKDEDDLTTIASILESAHDAAARILEEQLRIMACHETDDAHCIGWLENQLGPGTNIRLRMSMDGCENYSKVRLRGEQHATFADTLPKKLPQSAVNKADEDQSPTEGK